MKNIKLIIGLMCFVSIIQAQVTYTLNPAKSVNLSLPLNQSTGYKIYQVNTGNSKIILKWEKIFENLPLGWIYTTCDNSFCYGGVPAGLHVMDSISAGNQGFLGIDVDPANTNGAGVVQIYVYQDGYYNQGDTLTWNISTNAVGINEYTDNDLISIYPNPVNDEINVLLKRKYRGNNIRIIDFTGNIVIEAEITDLFSTVDVSGLPNGNYFLIIENKEHFIRKQFIKQ
ncbi:MAG: T9SS type A sorting domain-containing protein [Sediminibacterium sp.]|nr:T9SS type A sorting domain-containing protein [Sediminibacterium sp.]